MHHNVNRVFNVHNLYEENICATIIDSFNARIPKVIVIRRRTALSMFSFDATTPACLKVTEAGL